MIRPNQLWPLALTLLIAGCGSGAKTTTTGKPADPIAPATIKPGEEATLFPMAVGNQWVYDASGVSSTRTGGQQQNQTEVTFKMTKVTDVPGGQEAEFDVMANGNLTNKQKWLLNKEGLYQTATGKKLDPMTPMQPIVKFPIQEGATLEPWTGTGPFGDETTAKMSSTAKSMGPRLVDTEMGQVSAFMFQSTSKIEMKKTKGGTELTLWLKPGVGIVRLEQTLVFPDINQTMTLRLKSFTPHKP